MADFSKVHGKAAEETNLNFLRSEVVRLSAQVNALNNELMGRSSPRIPELMDALTQLTAVAQTHPEAKRGLARFFEVLDKAREASSALTVVRVGSN